MVDTDTKYRQATLIVILVISLVVTILLYYGDQEKWLIPALVSYVVLGLLLYWGNKKVFLVPYQKDQNSTNHTK